MAGDTVIPASLLSRCRCTEATALITIIINHINPHNHLIVVIIITMLAVFYGYGCLGFLFCAVWYYAIAETPTDHSTITSEEFHYIQSSRFDAGGVP